jgi:hypothetical protein
MAEGGRKLAVTGEGLKAFLSARDFLLEHREDYESAYRDFRWPQLDKFNWALDYFDTYACGNDKPALWIVDDGGSELKLSFAEMSRRSNQVANLLREQGVRRGDRILVQLSNHVAMWEIMLAACSSFHRFPAVSGYTVSFSPPISRRDEEGFSSCLAHPCHRAVAITPPECPVASVSLRRSILPSPHEGRLGLWGFRFEAISAFTLITAR